jgi:hypothetical protein
MNIINLIAELSPAQVFVAIMLLPWLVVAMMHTLSSAPRLGLDDNHMARARAAARWAQASPDPVTPAAGEVLHYRVRPAARSHSGTNAVPAYIEDEAA